MADPEVDWFNKNPEPQSFEVGDELTLWNYPVAKADVAPAHEEAIKRFASIGFIANSTDHEPMDFDVRGHASVTGAESANRDLAQRRGDNVKAVLNQLGFRSVVVESAGSSEPEDSGTSGQALARNRRVKVTRFMLKYKEVVEQPEPPKPTPRVVKDATKFSAPVRVQIDLPLRTVQTPKVVIAASIVGELSVVLKGAKSDPVDAGVTTTVDGTPQLTEEFAQLLARDVIGPKLGLDAGTADNPPVINIGIEAELWFLLPKVRYQEGPYLIDFNFKAIVARLPIVDYRSAQVHMEFSGNFRFQIGPSGSSVLLSTNDPGPTVTGAPAGFMDAGPLMIAATIADAGKQATPLAQTEIQKVVLNLATRDGAASRLALFVLGRDGDAAFAQRRADWGSRVGEPAQTAWSTESDQVDEYLQSLDKAAQEEKKAAWKKKYGGGQQSPEFDPVRELIFRDLKGYDEDQGDLKRLIEGL